MKKSIPIPRWLSRWTKPGRWRYVINSLRSKRCIDCVKWKREYHDEGICLTKGRLFCKDTIACDEFVESK